MGRRQCTAFFPAMLSLSLLQVVAAGAAGALVTLLQVALQVFLEGAASRVPMARMSQLVVAGAANRLGAQLGRAIREVCLCLPQMVAALPVLPLVVLADGGGRH